MEIKSVFFRDKQSVAEKSVDILPDEAIELAADASLEEKIIAAIRTVYDPEIHINIYDLGLIYEININHQAEVDIKMTLTAPACPVAEILPGKVADAVKLIDGVSDARVKLVWEPVWSRDCISDEAKLSLGLF